MDKCPRIEPRSGCDRIG